MRMILVLASSLVLSAVLFACSSDNSPDMDGGADGGDADTDSDADSDTDADGGGDFTCTGNTYDGDYEVAVAADLDGIAGYAGVSGNLEVSCSDCQDLSKLVCMETVGGNLYLNDNLQLASFAGLENLSGEMPGMVTIRNNLALTDLSALLGITSVVGSLWITTNGSMPNCEATDFRDALTSHGDVCIQDNLPDTCPDDTDGC